MKIFTFFISLFSIHFLQAQNSPDPWIAAQLGTITWQQTYEGMLADYHPVTITLASDNKLIAGTLVHKSDKRVHRLLGDGGKKDLFQLQERDEFDRLTGYLQGSITNDQLHLDWMSADQNRVFDIIAYPSKLIRIKSFKPVAEWIKVDAIPDIQLSIQKMDYGIVSGVARRNNEYSRFEGYCLDGSCSIWNTVLQNPSGAPIKLQMQQKDAGIYKAMIDGKEYSASITASIPLSVKHFDNSMGFQDFVYPELNNEAFTMWLGKWLDKRWQDGIAHLTSMNQPGSSGRLVHRTSGWIEIFDVGENHVSGLVTYINPGTSHREVFVLLKKENVVLTSADLHNTPDDLKNACDMMVKKNLNTFHDADYLNWLRSTGYSFMVPSMGGAVMLTEFNMIYGDDIRLMPVTDSRNYFRKKYWRYFGW